MAVTRVATVENSGTVQVHNKQGQYLHFTITAGGPVPIFTFVGKNDTRQASDFPNHPLIIYAWDHLKDPTQLQQLDLLAVSLSFFTNAKYRYTVEVFGADNKPASLAMDITYTGSPTDTTRESFNVILL